MNRNTKLLRVLDANFNRSREGLRVCEDICRFVILKKSGAKELRCIRHAITRQLKNLPPSSLLASRDAKRDMGRSFNKLERHRKDWQDIYMANLQRAKESLRVLEEVLKLSDDRMAGYFKRLRFKLYSHEKNHILSSGSK